MSITRWPSGDSGGRIFGWRCSGLRQVLWLLAMVAAMTSASAQVPLYTSPYPSTASWRALAARQLAPHRLPTIGRAVAGFSGEPSGNAKSRRPTVSVRVFLRRARAWLLHERPTDRVVWPGSDFWSGGRSGGGSSSTNRMSGRRALPASSSSINLMTGTCWWHRLNERPTWGTLTSTSSRFLSCISRFVAETAWSA